MVRQPRENPSRPRVSISYPPRAGPSGPRTNSPMRTRLCSLRLVPTRLFARLPPGDGRYLCAAGRSRDSHPRFTTWGGDRIAPPCVNAADLQATRGLSHLHHQVPDERCRHLREQHPTEAGSFHTLRFLICVAGAVEVASLSLHSFGVPLAVSVARTDPCLRSARW